MTSRGSYISRWVMLLTLLLHGYHVGGVDAAGCRRHDAAVPSGSTFCRNVPTVAQQEGEESTAPSLKAVGTGGVAAQ